MCVVILGSLIGVQYRAINDWNNWAHSVQVYFWGFPPLQSYFWFPMVFAKADLLKLLLLFVLQENVYSIHFLAWWCFVEKNSFRSCSIVKKFVCNTFVSLLLKKEWFELTQHFFHSSTPLFRCIVCNNKIVFLLLTQHPWSPK